MGQDIKQRDSKGVKVEAHLVRVEIHRHFAKIKSRKYHMVSEEYQKR